MSETKYVLVLLLILITGCAFYRTMDLSVSGGNVRSVYGSGDLNFHYQSNTVTRLFK